MWGYLEGEMVEQRGQLWEEEKGEGWALLKDALMVVMLVWEREHMKDHS